MKTALMLLCFGLLLGGQALMAVKPVELPQMNGDGGIYKMTDHPQAMPAECKVPGDPVQAYRNYYSNHKRRFAKWEPLAKTPHWF